MPTFITSIPSEHLVAMRKAAAGTLVLDFDSPDKSLVRAVRDLLALGLLKRTSKGGHAGFKPSTSGLAELARLDALA
jgi:hypothetical protein